MKALCIENGIDHPTDLHKAKVLCAATDRSKAKLMYLPLKKNGFVLCGYTEHFGKDVLLVTIGIDGVLDYDKLKVLLGDAANTYTVRSGSGGIHFYYLVTCPKKPKGADNKVVPSEDLAAIGAKEVDFKRWNQITFAPGTCFCKKYKYEVICDAIPKHFTDAEEYFKLEERICPSLGKKDVEDKKKEKTTRKLTELQISKIIAIIEKNNEKHHGSHDFWLTMAHFADSLGIEKSDTLLLFDHCVDAHKPYIDDAIIKDRLRAIEDAYEHPATGSRISEFITETDVEILTKIFKIKEDVNLAFEEYYRVEIAPIRPLIYLTNLHQWAQYNDVDGRYHDVTREYVQRFIIKWCDKFKIVTDKKVSHLLLRLQTLVEIDERATKHFPLICMHNCLLDIKTKKIYEHDPQIIFYQSDCSLRNYNEEEVVMPDIWVEALQRIPDEAQRQRFVQFIINIVHRYFDDESFLILFGKKRGGKGALLTAVEMLCEGSVGHTQFSELGSRFGFWGMYNKAVNIVKELGTEKLEDRSITAIKTIVGRDGELEIEGKSVRQFNWLIECFLIAASNALPKIRVDSESFLAVMCRLILIEIPTTIAEMDTSFKTRIAAADVADQMWSWCFQQTPQSILPKTAAELESYGKRTWIEWQTKSNTIARAIQDLFEYDATLGDYDRPVYTLNVFEVVSEINEHLRDAYDIEEPEDGKEKSFRRQEISQNLNYMGIRRNHEKYSFIRRVEEKKEKKKEKVEWDVDKLPVFR